MHRIPRAAAMVALTLLAAACGDDDPAAPSEGGLTEAEATVLAEVLLGLTLEAGSSASDEATVPARAPAAVARDFDLSFAFEAPCPLGGTLEVDLDLTGTADPDTGAGDLTMELVEVPRGCVVRHEDSGRRFELDGAPGITATVDVVADGEGAASFSGSYDGAVAWETDDRDGTCTFDLAFGGEGDELAGTASGTLEGTVCGVSVDHAWSR